MLPAALRVHDYGYLLHASHSGGVVQGMALLRLHLASRPGEA
jgi:hypothetical protein